MSVNFGYGGGYGMMNGMGMNAGASNFQSIASQYSCPTCYQYGPVPYNYQTYVNPLPKQVTSPSFISRVFKKMFGI